MLDWRVVTAEQRLQDSINDMKNSFDAWFYQYWAMKVTREKMLSPDSPLPHVYHKMCLPFDQVKELHLQESYATCNDCGTKTAIWIETHFSFCDEYGCGMVLCLDCAQKLKKKIAVLLKSSRMNKED